jgi:hypothetical protein
MLSSPTILRFRASYAWAQRKLNGTKLKAQAYTYKELANWLYSDKFSLRQNNSLCLWRSSDNR